MPRTMFVLKRLAMIPVSVVIVITLSFGLVELLPGDPATAIAGNFASPEQIEQIREDLGLNRSLVARYVSYLGDVIQGDFGQSFFSNQPIRTEIAKRLPATLELVGLSLALAAAIGVFLGVVGAYFGRGLPDRLTKTGITVFQSVPDFLLALLLIYFLFFILGWAPSPLGRMGLAGSGGVEQVSGLLLVDTLLDGNVEAFRRALRHLVLPTLALGIVYSAYLGKTARATMANALGSQQVEFARACGLPEHQVIRYAFLEARTPIITYMTILFGALLGGAAIVETIFSWQGVGEWALDAMLNLDIPAIQGFIVVAGVATILLYLALDVAVMLLDPRVRLDG